jgi:hypothetical protein
MAATLIGGLAQEGVGQCVHCCTERWTLAHPVVEPMNQVWRSVEQKDPQLAGFSTHYSLSTFGW